MTIVLILWFAGGAALGVLHAVLLKRSARAAFGAVVGRLLLVGGGLTAAAVFGFIIPAALGWLCGFGGLAAVFGLRREGWSRSKSSSIQ